jgi:hypothetical protein
VPDETNEQTTPAFSVGRRRWWKEGVGGREVFWCQKISPEAAAEKPSENLDKPHFQRHSLPGPDFWAENGKNAIFSLETL